MDRKQTVELVKRALYRGLAIKGMDPWAALEKQAASPAAAAAPSVMTSLTEALERMGTDLGTAVTWTAVPTLAGGGIGAGFERLTSPPTVSVSNAKKRELLDAYDRAINEIKARIETRRSRAAIK